MMIHDASNYTRTGMNRAGVVGKMVHKIEEHCGFFITPRYLSSLRNEYLYIDGS